MLRVAWEELSGGIQVMTSVAAASDRGRTNNQALLRLLGTRKLLHRPDGKPQAGPAAIISDEVKQAHRTLDGRDNSTVGNGVDAHADLYISASHTREVSAAVASERPVACDLEPVVDRKDSDWRSLLGNRYSPLAQEIAARDSGNLGLAATRVWTARECLKKAGMPSDSPLVYEADTEDGWVVLRTGETRIMSYTGEVHGTTAPLALAVLVQ